MQKTVSALRAAGCLSVSRKTGLFCVSPVPSMLPARVLTASAAPEKRPALDQLITADILRGEFSEREFLPPIKQLSTRYGVCYRSIRIRLAQLCERGVLKPVAKRFALVRGAQSPAGASLFLISISNAQGVYTGLTPSRFELLRSIEYECHSRGISLRVFTCRFDLGLVSAAEGLTAAVSASRSRGSCIGTILLPLMITPDRLDEIFATLEQFRAPLAIIDEGGDYSCIHRPIALADVRQYTVSGGPGCGARMARLLFERGHRRVAFVSSSSNAAWTVRRYEGFRAEFERFRRATVIPMLLDIGDSPRTPRGSQNKHFDTMAASVGGLQSIVTASPDDISSLSLDIIERLSRHIDRSARHAAFEPFADSILRDPTITAVVCANDVDALCMIELLGKRTRRNARRVFGFDDSYEAAARHVSSYHFDCRGLARSVISALLYPRNTTLAPPVPQSGIIESDGYVVER